MLSPNSGWGRPTSPHARYSTSGSFSRMGSMHGTSRRAVEGAGGSNSPHELSRQFSLTSGMSVGAPGLDTLVGPRPKQATALEAGLMTPRHALARPLGGLGTAVAGAAGG